MVGCLLEVVVNVVLVVGRQVPVVAFTGTLVADSLPASSTAETAEPDALGLSARTRLLDTAVATSEGALTAASAAARPVTRRGKTSDSNPNTRQAPIQNLCDEAIECKACAKASGRLDVQTRRSASDRAALL